MNETSERNNGKLDFNEINSDGGKTGNNQHHKNDTEWLIGLTPGKFSPGGTKEIAVRRVRQISEGGMETMKQRPAKRSDRIIWEVP